MLTARSFHQREELCIVSCGNSSRVDTKRGLRGKAFGSFSLVINEKRAVHNTTVEYLRSSRLLTVQVVQQAYWGRFKFFTFGRDVAKKRNTSTA